MNLDNYMSCDLPESSLLLGGEEFVRRVGRDNISTYRQAREETPSVAALREAICVEREVDERVKALYGV